MTELRKVYITDELSGTTAEINENGELLVTLNGTIDSDGFLKIIPYDSDGNSVNFKTYDNSIGAIETTDQVTQDLLNSILKELKKLNMSMYFMTDIQISDLEID